MKASSDSSYGHTRRLVLLYLGIAGGIVLLLGLLHWGFADLKLGKTYWFNLDKERNLPTWFSGLLFFAVGSAALVAFYWEQKRNTEGLACFRLPILWLGVGLTGLALSLDEMTILHENFYWREIRLLSSTFGDPWKYITQWQVLLAPFIIFFLSYFTLFFSNRLQLSPTAKRCSFAGLGCWIGALSLEGVRQTFKQLGPQWYTWEVVLEEMLEMLGSLFVLAAILFYTVDVALGFTEERRNRVLRASQFLTARALTTLAITVLVLSASGSLIYFFAYRQVIAGDPLPRLYKKAAQLQTRAEPSDAVPALEAQYSGVWFDDLFSIPPLTKTEGEAGVRFIASALQKRSIGQAPFPPALLRDRLPRILFLSISDGQHPAHVVVGMGKGLVAAASQVIRQAQGWITRGHSVKWFKVDIVQRVFPLKKIAPTRVAGLERSLHGIAFDRQSRIAFIPEELATYRLVSNKGKLRWERMATYIAKHEASASIRFKTLQQSGTFDGHRFTTASFFLDGTSVVRLYRGHRSFDDPTPDSLLAAARQGGKYLTKAVKTKGEFVYSYLPRTDTKRDSYNILRHAGTTYAMLELFAVTKEAPLLEAAQRAIHYLLRVTKPCPSGDAELLCVVEDDAVKLGGNALAIIALAKYTEVTQDQRYLPTLLRLGKWIQQVQNDTGQFFIHKQRYSDGVIRDTVSQYYPGEALLALTRLAALDPNGGWLDTAERGAQYLIRVRDGDVQTSDLSHDHWFLYALNELYRVRPQPLYREHALRITQAIIESQNRTPRYPDWLGSYYRPPRSTPTATRTEGLCAIYALARDFGDPEEAATILKAIRLGIAFQLQTQFRPESALYLKNPQRALGGFHRSLTNFEIRIDYVQHNISSLLGLYRNLRTQENRPYPTR